MFAVVKTGGKQYKVSAGDIIEVEKLEGDIGATILLKDLVLFNDGSKDNIGAKAVDGISIAAEVINQKRGDKVLVFKKRRRHNYRRLNGHRQSITVLKIAEIGKGLSAKAAPVKTEKAEAKPAKAKPAKKEAAQTTKKSEAKTSVKKESKTTKTAKSKKE